MLITLAVIGIVAALTIPIMLTKIHDKKYHVQLTKSFAELDQALKMIEVEGNSLHIGDGDSEGLRDQFADKMRILKTDMMSEFYSSMEYRFYKSTSTGNLVDLPALVLSNGNVIRFQSYSMPTEGLNALAYICLIIGSPGDDNLIMGVNLYYFLKFLFN